MTKAPQQLTFARKLSIIVIFKLCKFNAKSLDIVFFVLQKVHRPFNTDDDPGIACL